MIERARVAVIAAHPDDEVLGCGGAMARLSQEGHEVSLSILGEGVTARYPQREQAAKELIENLQSECRQAAGILGVKEVRFYRLPDNRFDTVPLLEVIKRVEEIIGALKPDAIYTHHGGDLNIDHAIVHRAVLTAARPLPGQSVKEIYAFEVASSTEWGFHSLQPAFRPNVFVDISSTLETKLLALAQYQTEAKAWPHPRSPEAVRVLARRWGSVAGCEAAEAFELIRALR